MVRNINRTPFLMRIVHAFNVGLVKITKSRIYELLADDLTFISIQFFLRYCISINIFQRFIIMINPEIGELQ